MEGKDMLTVDDYGAIRRAKRDGKTIRQIAREFGHSRNTVRKILNLTEPNPLPQKRLHSAPVLGPFQPLIERILKDDEAAPPKQRHTAAQIHRRLCQEHQFEGSYTQVRRFVRTHRRNTAETFVPLAHPAGQRIEADFGHIHVDFPDGRRMVPFLVAVWAYSNAPFVMALPFERTEAERQRAVQAIAGTFVIQDRLAEDLAAAQSSQTNTPGGSKLDAQGGSIDIVPALVEGRKDRWRTEAR